MAMIGKVKRMYFPEKKSAREIVRLTSLSRGAQVAEDAGAGGAEVTA